MDLEGYTSANGPNIADNLCIPVCEENLKPKIGLAFSTLEKGIKFYEDYGAACGFTTRKITVKRANDDTVTLRYVVCNREGVRKVSANEVAGEQRLGKQKRRRLSCRIYCRARVVFSFEAGIGYVISKFIEGHNHEMVSEGYRYRMNVNRNVDYGHQMFIVKCAKANIGPMRSFRIFKEPVGNYEDVGYRKEKSIGFFLAYSVDDSSKLTRLFWADSVSVENYKIFGEAASLDATYSTNRYSMIFTPFTGRDNHGKCVTFGAGLLSREDQESYSWVLTKFVEWMGSYPKMLISDQDLGLTRHRLCIWHIMMKVADKLPVSLKESEDFKPRLYDIVWSDTYEPDVFEEKWQTLMVEFDLCGHKWFEDMYELRSSWVPAYFHDEHMSGLFRTTLLSESENSFFRRYLNKSASLSEMYTLFESALESQRDDHDDLSLVDQTRMPKMKTKLGIERHAASVYTNSIFASVQKEIEECVMFCTIPNSYAIKGGICYDVDEDAVAVFNVTYNVTEDVISCSCKYFIRQGLVCNHMFAIMKNLKIKSIPNKYICNRWTKNACSVFDAVGQNRYSSSNVKRIQGNDGIFSLFCRCIGRVEGNDCNTPIFESQLYTYLLQ